MSESEPISSEAASSKEPWLAVILSTLFPGIGQIYSGDKNRGWILIFTQISLFTLGLILVISPTGNIAVGLSCLLATLVVSFINLFDAHRCAKKRNTLSFEQSRKSVKDPWLAVFLSQLIPGLGHFYLRSFLLGIFFLIIWLIVSGILPIFSVIIPPLIAYHAYISAPVKREVSKKKITIIASLLLVSQLISTSLGMINRKFIAEARYIPSGNMLPTLQIGDRLIVDKLSYRFKSPQRGDIIVFHAPEALERKNFRGTFIHRLIALPGEKVEVKNKRVYINNNPITEDYIVDTPNYQFGPVVVPPDAYFVLGDNRNNSYDSQYWGFVPKDKIIGKVYKRFWPFETMGTVK